METLGELPAERIAAALQWGHAFVSVETGGGGWQLLWRWPALQWGHAFVSVETPKPTAGRGRGILLQWGHAFVSVETCLKGGTNER